MARFKRVLLLLLIITAFKKYSGQKCGRPLQSSKIDGKIVGGYEVGYYKYPWFATLLLDGEAWCGGTLIGPSTVVTAAHCFKDQLTQPNAKLQDVFTVKLGVYNSCIHEKTQKEYKVKKVQVHKNYLSKQPYYDIALMTLNGDTSAYEPACLPPKALGDHSRGREGYIIGLGTIKYGASKYPCNLNEGRILLYKDKVCKSMIVNATDDKEDYAYVNAFCGGYMKGGVDACQGDSGGPVHIIGPTGEYCILGLTSFGYDCGKKNLLGIYTDVSHYLDWIKERTGITPSQPTPTTTKRPASTTNDEIEESTSNVTPPPDTEQPPAKTEFPVFPWTYPSSARPPPYYTTKSPQINNGNGNGGVWPPKRIIIEFKKKNHKKGHKKGHPKKYKKGHPKKNKKSRPKKNHERWPNFNRSHRGHKKQHYSKG